VWDSHTASGEESRSFSHVVYLDGDCDNMFGWGNFLFWPQV
jgi:hypothetical protein